MSVETNFQTEQSALIGKKVVIIGGAGFIGHNMALKMKSLGVEVAVIDSLGVNNYYAIERERYTNPNGEIYLNFIKQRMNLLHQAQRSDHSAEHLKHKVTFSVMLSYALQSA